MYGCCAGIWTLYRCLDAVQVSGSCAGVWMLCTCMDAGQVSGCCACVWMLCRCLEAGQVVWMQNIGSSGSRGGQEELELSVILAV